MLIVCSKVENFDLRNAIRNTWAYFPHKKFNVTVAFLMGLSTDSKLNVSQNFIVQGVYQVLKILIYFDFWKLALLEAFDFSLKKHEVLIIKFFFGLIL